MIAIGFLGFMSELTICILLVWIWYTCLLHGSNYDYAVPTGIKIFSWLFTMAGGIFKWLLQCYFQLVSVFIYNGWCYWCYLSNAGLDIALHDTYYVLVISTMSFLWVLYLVYCCFLLLNWIISWLKYSDILAKLHFWLTLLELI